MKAKENCEAWMRYMDAIDRLERAKKGCDMECDKSDETWEAEEAVEEAWQDLLIKYQEEESTP